jgi:hypothetical protein
MQKELDSTLKTNIDNLNAVSHHDISPAGVLGMTHWEGSGDRNEARIPYRELSDGTSLVSLTGYTRAKLRDLAPGSIIAVSSTKKPTINTVDADLVLLYETVAMVIEHNHEGTLLFGVVRQPRPNEQYQGAWGQYRVGDTIYREKDDAVDVLQRLFHPQKGIEATQMLSTVFSLTGNGNMSIASAGCFSHEKPKGAIPQNFLLGDTRMVPPIFIDKDDPTKMLRVRMNLEGTQLHPIVDLTGDTDESHLLARAYTAKAHHIAYANPQGLGAGTKPERVLDALFDTTLTIAEVAGNGGTVAQGQQILKGNLGLR